ncbi:hypothetical protein SARC_03903 [Sphaeroforma arctica JP610]|uniref:Uncharacterized protein n=1 Tax=Sphaeroforma arctica JP610 TaxID=667725 RepID=A0A0L0G6L6_9EUKA|nr:hypothetical protein SARC_03903 [Sphaeroforma arctica JP610]KNC83878.1 hypothetical protein SARC_03903 [Sphaeroforma arctica JP610]|eukprot:XP_014157780.1 hypothetical protein SARC_03903 [Sphaeroforma arctica JP610]
MGYSDFKKHKSVYSMIKERESNKLKPVEKNSSNAYAFGKFLPNQTTSGLALSSQAFCGNYTTDGQTFMSACQDMYIRLFHYSKGRHKLKRAIKCQDLRWSVLDVDFSPDQKNLIYSSWSNYVHLCDVREGSDDYGTTELNFSDSGDFNLGHVCHFSVKFSSDSKYIVAGNNAGKLVAYDLEAMKPSLFIQGHTGDVNAVMFAKDNSSIVYSGSDDGLCKVWDTRLFRSASVAKPVGVLSGHRSGLASIDSKSDGRYLVTNSKDHTDSINGPGTSFDYRFGGSFNSFMPPGDHEDDNSIMTYRGHYVSRTLCRVKFSSEHTTGERFIAAGSADGDICIWDVLTGAKVRILKGHDDVVRDVAFHPYENILASSSWDMSIRIWEHSDCTRAEREAQRGDRRRSSQSQTSDDAEADVHEVRFAHGRFGRYEFTLPRGQYDSDDHASDPEWAVVGGSGSDEVNDESEDGDSDMDGVDVDYDGGDGNGDDMSDDAA